ncbi:MAG: VWA domain-containing protein [Planctomycetia bacterium]|nr:VWA domain-containing protein [Planctomycetia bacterium]
MNADDTRPDPRAVDHEAIDPREREASLLTALALGELSGDEREAVATRLQAADAADTRRQVEEVRALATVLRGIAADGQPTPVTGTASIREAVEAALAAAAPGAPPEARGGWPARRLTGLLACGALVASLALVMVVDRSREGREVARVSAPARSDRLAEVTEVAEVEDFAVVTGGEAQVTAGGSGYVAAPAPASGPHPGGVTLLYDPRPTSPDPQDMPAAMSDEAAPPLPVEVARRAGTVAGLPGLRGAIEREFVREAEAGKQLDLNRAPFAGRPGPAADALSSFELRLHSRESLVRERYAQFVENPFEDPATAPLSTFSIDVDTASYTILRRFLTGGQRPPPDAVRLEEMLNYFRYADPAPAADGDPFAVRLETADCPWRPGHRLLRVGIKGREIEAATRPAGNLVFLVDVSGSMADPDKLPLVKQALTLLVDQLREEDRVSIVTYAGDAGLKLPATGGHRAAEIRAVIDQLGAGGSTHGSAGIELAYDEARKHFIAGGVNRVILCTDGDLNVGITDDGQLVKLIRQRAAEGTFLTVLGFGRGNLQDEKMEKLADNGNGLYAYVDSVREARKVLVEQLTGSTVTIAKDVKIQVEFNPAQVASYRLLGYENRVLAARDFADDTRDAGEIGAGHGVTALYEWVPAAAGGGPLPELKYQSRPAPSRPAVAGPASRELLTLKLRFKEPAGSESVLREIPLVDAGGSFESASDDLRFAAAVAAFGMLLRSSDHAGTATLPLVARIAGDALGTDPGGLRAEFLDLVRAAAAVLPPAHQ